MAGEMLGPILASIHNIRHFQRLVLDIRRAIRENAWPLFHESWPVVTANDLDFEPPDSPDLPKPSETAQKPD
jgi:queuine/archaeosine tRNA-ribosyltransferase